MGRAAVLICAGFAVIFSIITFSIHNSQANHTKLNVDYVNQSQARNNAMSGVQFGMWEILTTNNFNWRPDPHPWGILISDMPLEVYVDDHNSHPGEVNPYQLRVRAESTLDGRTGYAHALLEYESILPSTHGAMSFYTDQTNLDINGNAFKFVGVDTNPDGTPGPEGYKPGVVADVSTYGSLLDGLNNPQIQNIQNNGYEEAELDLDELQEHIDKYSPVAEIFDEESLSPLGHPDQPRIVKLNGEADVPGVNSEGAGILLVPDGSTLTIKGDFTFHGLIIVQGKLDLRGRIDVYGSMLFGGELESEYKQDEETYSDPDDATYSSGSGRVHVYYSSSALANANNSLAHIFGVGVTVTEIFD